MCIIDHDMRQIVESAWVIDTQGPEFPCREAVLVRVERALPIASPVYMFGDAHEAELSRLWSGIYGLH